MQAYYSALLYSESVKEGGLTAVYPQANSTLRKEICFPDITHYLQAVLFVIVTLCFLS